ncbi:MAG TPA: hypothetical protein PKB09_03360 [Candidatus Saccharibacteria bacterium]|nr:hypothetical protein [Candidatus Saccharibacteria bacterium]
MDEWPWYEQLMDDVEAAVLEYTETPQCLQRHTEKYGSAHESAKSVEESERLATRFVGRENRPPYQQVEHYGVYSDYETCSVERRVCGIKDCAFSLEIALNGIRRNMVEPATQLGDCSIDN